MSLIGLYYRVERRQGNTIVFRSADKRLSATLDLGEYDGKPLRKGTPIRFRGALSPENLLYATKQSDYNRLYKKP